MSTTKTMPSSDSPWEGERGPASNADDIELLEGVGGGEATLTDQHDRTCGAGREREGGPRLDRMNRHRHGWHDRSVAETDAAHTVCGQGPVEIGLDL